MIEVICSNERTSTSNHASNGDGTKLQCKSGDQVYDEQSICQYDTVDDKLTYCEDGTHLGASGTCTDFACYQGYKCRNSYCIPIRKICDGRSDCPGQEDEYDCEDYTCPGHVQCAGQSFCVATWELCDGVWHCPYGDDEKYCQICPEDCSCSGSAVSCSNVRDVSPVTLYQSPTALLLKNSSAIYMILISSKDTIFHSLCSLQLVSGQIYDIVKPSPDMFPVLQVLHVVKFNINKVTEHFINGSHIKHLNLSHNKIYLIENGAFNLMENIKILSLFSNAIAHLEWHFCHRLRSLQYLFIADNPLIDISPVVFASNHHLMHVESDWHMVCYVASSIALSECSPRDDGLSSCSHLLHSNAQNVVIQMQATGIIVGNIFALTDCS